MGVSLKFFLLVSVDENIEWADAVQKRKKGYASRDLSNDVTNFLLDLLFILFRGLSVLWLRRFVSLARVRVGILPRWGSIFLRDVLVLLNQNVLRNLSSGFSSPSCFQNFSWRIGSGFILLLRVSTLVSSDNNFSKISIFLLNIEKFQIEF